MVGEEHRGLGLPRQVPRRGARRDQGQALRRGPQQPGGAPTSWVAGSRSSRSTSPILNPGIRIFLQKRPETMVEKNGETTPRIRNRRSLVGPNRPNKRGDRPLAQGCLEQPRARHPSNHPCRLQVSDNPHPGSKSRQRIVPSINGRSCPFSSLHDFG